MAFPLEQLYIPLILLCVCVCVGGGGGSVCACVCVYECECERVPMPAGSHVCTHLSLSLPPSLYIYARNSYPSPMCACVCVQCDTTSTYWFSASTFHPWVTLACCWDAKQPTNNNCKYTGTHQWWQLSLQSVLETQNCSSIVFVCLGSLTICVCYSNKITSTLWNVFLEFWHYEIIVSIPSHGNAVSHKFPLLTEGTVQLE